MTDTVGLRNSAATYGARASWWSTSTSSVVTHCSDCDVHRDWSNFYGLNHLLVVSYNY